MPSTDDAAQYGAGSTPLRVYAPGLERTAGLVDDGLTGTFAPAVNNLFAVYQAGTPFGAATLSPALARARALHHECLVRASETLARYIWASSVLVDAVRTVTTNYSEADLSAAANSDEVERILLDAIATAKARAVATASTEARSANDARAYGSGYAANPQVETGM